MASWRGAVFVARCSSRERARVSERTPIRRAGFSANAGSHRVRLPGDGIEIVGPPRAEPAGTGARRKETLGRLYLQYKPATPRLMPDSPPHSSAARAHLP